MVIDIRYHDKAPEQIQRIRMITLYPHQLGTAAPEIVLHSDEHKPQRNIPTSEILYITITRD